MPEKLLFLKKFLRHGTRIASAVPSSRWVAERAVHNVRWDTARIILELGPGTGPLTEAILSHARPESDIFAIERDPDFVKFLRDKFKNYRNIEIIEGNCADLEDILTARRIARVDYIISGLPVGAFRREEYLKLFRAVRAVLSPEGSYNQLTEFPLLFLPFYRRYFGDVQFLFEPRNIPPGGIYICRRPKEI